MPDLESPSHPASNPGSKPRIAAVILAAGASARLGQPKQLIQVAGESLLRRTARLAVEAGCAPVFAVLGYEAARIRVELDGLAVQVVVNEEWSEGMGASLRCGAAAASPFHRESAGILVLVCDQPLLTREHLQNLIDRHTRGTASITASLYAGQAGVPAVFAAQLLPELLVAEGDRGARNLIRQFASQVQTAAWPDGALDVDFPEQLQGWVAP